MARRAIYAGSFDPFTNGHLHVLREASQIFDHVCVLIASNPDKKRFIDPMVMQKAIIETYDKEGLNNVGIGQTLGLTSDFAALWNFNYLVRGIRNGTDYQYEENMAQVNEKLGLKTIYIRAGELGYISSSMVRELLKYEKDVSNYVPRPIYEVLQKR